MISYCFIESLFIASVCSVPCPPTAFAVLAPFVPQMRAEHHEQLSMLSLSALLPLL